MNKGTFRQKVKIAFYDSVLRRRWLAFGDRSQKRVAQRAHALREKGRTSYPCNRGRGRKRA